MGDVDSVLKIILMLIGFGAILFLTYVTTRYIARKQIRSMKSRNISVIETVMLGPDKRLHLVRAGKSHILIASTSKSVEFLTAVELDEAEAMESSDEEENPRFDFRSVFEKYSGLYRAKNEDKINGEKSTLSEEEQEGPIFRRNLEKLRIILNKSKNNDIDKDGDDVTNDKGEKRS